MLREDELMRELEVGRTPLREAVKRLALENLVAVQPRRGTFVSPVEASDIENISEVRAELEGYAAELAARRLDGDHRAAAEALLREVEQLAGSGDQDWLMRFDERIHRFTWEASGNPYLQDTLERYFTHSLRVWYLVLDRLPGLEPRRPRPGPPGRGAARRATPSARARSCASTCSTSSASCSPPSAGTERWPRACSSTASGATPRAAPPSRR